jgi:hypothetical protein
LAGRIEIIRHFRWRPLQGIDWLSPP